MTAACLAAGLSLAVCVYWYPTRSFRSYEYVHRHTYSKQNLHSLQQAAEEYALAHGGHYPDSLTQMLAAGGRLRDLPANPYTPPGGIGVLLRAESTLPLPEVPLGGHVPGGVTYLPHFTQASGKREATGYALVLYCGEELAEPRRRASRGPERRELPGGAEGQVAWDYVLLILAGGDWPPRPWRTCAGLDEQAIAEGGRSS